MFYEARASSLLQRPDPVPSRPVYPAERDGTGRDRDGIFKMGRDCAYAVPPMGICLVLREISSN